MKRHYKRTLCLLCSLLILFSTVGFAARTPTETGDNAPETYDGQQTDFALTGIGETLESESASGGADSAPIPEETWAGARLLDSGVLDGARLLDSGVLDSGALGNETPSDSASRRIFALSGENFGAQYTLTATAGPGGIVSPDGDVSVPEGGSQTFRVYPDDGYTLKMIYINGEAAVYSSDDGPALRYTYYEDAYEYTFRDVAESASLYAEFAKDINGCEIVAEERDGELYVTVTDPEKAPGKQKLTEGADYLWSLTRVDAGTDGTKTYLSVQAAPDSAYSGVAMEPYDDGAPALTDGQYDADKQEVRVTAVNADTLTVVAAAYTPDGKMLTFFPPEACERLEKTARGVPVRIALDGVSLPERYVVKAFLLADMDSLRVADKPISVPVSPAD